MASPTTYFSILIFLTLFSSLHVHARESKFFSKFTNDNNAKQLLPPKEQEQPLNKPEQEPNFIPQNQQNSGGYGLYGHESGQLPPTTTTTENLPYTTETENSYNKESIPSSNNGQYYNNDAQVNTESYSNNDQYYNNNAQVNTESYSNNGQYYNNDAYVTKPQGMSDTRFMDEAYKP
nr:PREDICTED: protein E6-like [Daucus carota subsp. sativus]